MGWNHQLVLYINMNFLNMMVSLIWFQGWGLYIWSTLSEVVANAGCGGGLTKPPERHYNIWGMGWHTKNLSPNKKCLIEVYVPYDSFHIYTRYPGKNGTAGRNWNLLGPVRFFFVHKEVIITYKPAIFGSRKRRWVTLKRRKSFEPWGTAVPLLVILPPESRGKIWRFQQQQLKQVGEFHVLRCWKNLKPTSAMKDWFGIFGWFVWWVNDMLEKCGWMSHEGWFKLEGCFLDVIANALEKNWRFPFFQECNWEMPLQEDFVSKVSVKTTLKTCSFWNPLIASCGEWIFCRIKQQQIYI